VEEPRRYHDTRSIGRHEVGSLDGPRERLVTSRSHHVLGIQRHEMPAASIPRITQRASQPFASLRGGQRVQANAKDMDRLGQMVRIS